MRLLLAALSTIVLPSSPIIADTSQASYTIEELKAIARSAHPTLAAVEAGVAHAEGLLRQARAYPNPVLTTSGGRGEVRGGGASRSESSFELAQPIELPSVRSWRARVSALGLEVADQERVVARSVIDASVVRLAYTVVAEGQRAEIAREGAEIAGRLSELLAHRVELGESSPLEAARARSEWFVRRRELLDATGALDAARAALNLFCGDRLGGRFEVVVRRDTGAPVDLPSDLVARLRARNPVLTRAQIAVRQAEAAVESERRARLPQVELLAGHEAELDRTADSLGVSLTIPLWNRNRGAIDAAQAERVREARHKDQISVDLEIELARATADYRRARAAIEIHLEGWTAAAEESLRIASFSFQNGEASLLELLDAQRSSLEVKLAEVNAWAALRLARAEIEQLIGSPIEPEGNHETP